MEDYDLIYAMASDVLDDMKRISHHKFGTTKVDLFLNETYPGENRDGPDPWSGPESEYHEAFVIINEGCESIIKKYSV
jgi:protein-tyrosine phosphatase